MHNVATLYKQLPQRKRVPNKETSKVLRETERDEDDIESPRRASAAVAGTDRRRSSIQEYQTTTKNLTFASAAIAGPPVKTVTKKDKKQKHSKSAALAQFNFEKEKPQINNVIGHASIEATGLMNALKHVNRETQRVSDNPECKRRFESCKDLRRQTYRYCSLVMDEGYLGTLLNANDQLSDALILYEQLDKSFDYDSDSEDYEDPDATNSSTGVTNSRVTSPTSPAFGLAKLSLNSGSPPPQPPRPRFTSPVFTTADSMNPVKGKEREDNSNVEEEDENDPFGDSHAINTPQTERTGMNW